MVDIIFIRDGIVHPFNFVKMRVVTRLKLTAKLRITCKKVVNDC